MSSLTAQIIKWTIFLAAIAVIFCSAILVINISDLCQDNSPYTAVTSATDIQYDSDSITGLYSPSELIIEFSNMNPSDVFFSNNNTGLNNISALKTSFKLSLLNIYLC